MSIGKEEAVEPCRQPKRHKLAILTFVGLLAPVYFLPPVLAEVLNGPRLLNFSAAVAGIVVLMTYVIMPVLTHLAANWLYEPTHRESQISGDKTT